MIKEILYIHTAYYSLLRDEHTVFIYSPSFLPTNIYAFLSSGNTKENI